MSNFNLKTPSSRGITKKTTPIYPENSTSPHTISFLHSCHNIQLSENKKLLQIHEDIIKKYTDELELFISNREAAKKLLEDAVKNYKEYTEGDNINKDLYLKFKIDAETSILNNLKKTQEETLKSGRNSILENMMNNLPEPPEKVESLKSSRFCFSGGFNNID